MVWNTRRLRYWGLDKNPWDNTAPGADETGNSFEGITLDFTDTTDGDGDTSYTYDDYDLFGDGSLTVDITVTANSGTLNKIDHGWGTNDGSSTQLNTGESLTFTFSDLKGDDVSSIAGFEFVGLISSTQYRLWSQTSDDVIDVNGVTLTTYDDAQSDSITMAYVDVDPYDLESDFTTAGDDTSGLTISTDGAFTISQVADSGRIAGFQINIIKNEN